MSIMSIKPASGISADGYNTSYSEQWKKLSGKPFTFSQKPMIDSDVQNLMLVFMK